MNNNKKHIIVGLGVCIILSIILVIIIVPSVLLKPTRLADDDDCYLHNITDKFTLKEVYLSIGYKLKLYLDNDQEYGYITSTKNYDPTKNVYQLRSKENDKTQAQATQKIFSFGTNYRYKSCDKKYEYIVKETITETFGNTNKIYTTYTVFKDDKEIAKSKKLSLIDTEIDIIDNNNILLSKMKRNFGDSILYDVWHVENYNTEMVDNWVVAMIPSLVTIKQREKQNDKQIQGNTN